MATVIWTEEDFVTDRGDKGSKRAIRFNCFKDVMLLRAVIGKNPFSGNSQKPWDAVAQSLQLYLPHVTSRCCRERTMRLIKMFRENDRANLRTSGTEELYDEKEQLLKEISSLEEECKVLQEEQHRKKQQRDLDENEVVDGMQAAAVALLASPSMSRSENSCSADEDIRPRDEDIKPRDEDIRPHDEDNRPRVRKRRASPDVVTAYLSKKHAAEISLRKAELAFQKEKLEIDKQRISLEEKKLELERERWQREREHWQGEREERRKDRQMMLDLIQLVLQKRSNS